MRLNVQASQAEKNRAEMRADNLLQQLRAMTPAQAAAWVEANINTAAQQKQLLKVMIKALVFLANDND